MTAKTPETGLDAGGVFNREGAIQHADDIRLALTAQPLYASPQDDRMGGLSEGGE